VPFPTPYTAEMYEAHDFSSFYMNHPNICFRGKGLYAGFVNVAKSYTEDLWTPMMEYLLQRYFIVENDSTPLMSNAHNTIGQDPVATNDIGKDEKLLIFVYARLALDDIYIMYIDYTMLTPRMIEPKPNSTHTQELLDNSMITPGYVETALGLTFRDINRVVKRWHATYEKETKNNKDSVYKIISYEPYFGDVSRHDMNRGVDEYFKEEFTKLRNAYNLFLKRINPHQFYQTIHTFIRATQKEGAYFYKQKAPSMKNIVYKKNSKITTEYPWPADAHASTVGLWRRILRLRPTKKNRGANNTRRKLQPASL
jgi:hypothetical protein